jgi:NAD(P)H-dependent flavin oxidoreductase YrpB (nitropropane dioxygenase family)
MQQDRMDRDPAGQWRGRVEMTAEFLPSRLPIIQAPMAGSQGVELCAAVCEAGGLGSLPTAMLTPSELRGQIDESEDDRAVIGRLRR